MLKISIYTARGEHSVAYNDNDEVGDVQRVEIVVACADSGVVQDTVRWVHEIPKVDGNDESPYLDGDRVKVPYPVPRSYS